MCVGEVPGVHPCVGEVPGVHPVLGPSGAEMKLYI